jgi:hypothetical protein
MEDVLSWKGRSAGRMHDLELGTRGAVPERQLNEAFLFLILDDVIAHLPRDGADLIQVVAPDSPAELGEPRIHQHRQHPDLDALVEFLATPGKPEAQAVVEMNMAHVVSPRAP